MDNILECASLFVSFSEKGFSSSFLGQADCVDNLVRECGVLMMDVLNEICCASCFTQVKLLLSPELYVEIITRWT